MEVEKSPVKDKIIWAKKFTLKSMQSWIGRHLFSVSRKARLWGLAVSKTDEAAAFKVLTC